MALTVLLPLLAFLLLCLVLAGKEPRGTDRETEPAWQVVILQAAVLWGVLLTVLTDGLSLLTSVNRLGLSLAWTGVLAGLVLYGWRSGRLKCGWEQVRTWAGGLRRIPRAEAVILAVVGVLALALLAVALVAPPNTNDSMRYHMARVMHWQQNQTLAHYPTSIEVQLWMPPWAEMAILHLVVLEGSDRLANLVQWLAMLGSLAGVAWLARRLGAGIAGQVFAVVFAFTIPMGILQSTSTQNDYVTAFWVVCLAVFVLRDLDGQPSAWLMGLTTGLGVLTKGTFYAYALVILGGWGVVVLGRQVLRRQAGGSIQIHLPGLVRIGQAAGVVVVCILALNSYFWWQNLRTFQSPLGPPVDVTSHANGYITPASVASNLIRNSTLHLGTPWDAVNARLKNWVLQIHTWMGQDADDPATSNGKFRVRRYLTEDRAGNTWHFLGIPGLAGLAWLGCWWASRREHRLGRASEQSGHRARLCCVSGWYALGLALVFLLFSIVYRWQDTGSRLHLPWFVLMAPLAGALWELLSWVKIRRLDLRYAVTLMFLLLALPSVFTNPSRPFFPYGTDPHTVWNTPRDKLIFRNFYEVRTAYESLMTALESTGCQQVGMRLDTSDPEYFIWALAQYADYPARLEHLHPAPPTDGFSPCAVICTICTLDEMDGLPLHSEHPQGYRLYYK